MAMTFFLTDLRGNNEFNLLTGDAKTLLTGAQMFTRDDRALWHMGADGSAQLLELLRGDRGAAFQVTLGGTVDEAYNNLVVLERWLTQANEAELGDGRTWPVYLAVKRDTATNTTYNQIKYATLDTSGAVIHPVTNWTNNAIPVYGATVVLSLHPGTTSEPVQLYNAVVNGAVQRWLADKSAPLGWSAHSTATLTRVADRVLIGQHAAKVTVTATGRGIQTDLVTVPAYHLALGHMWISLDNGSGTWKLELLSTGGTVLASQAGITYAWVEANAEQEAVDRTGNTWYLVKVAQAIGDITVERTMRLRLSETTNIGTDSVYVNAGLIKTVQASTLPPSPDNVKSSGGAGFDTLTLDTDHATVTTDETNKFEGTSAFDITFDTTVGTDGLYQTVLFDKMQQGQLYTAKTWVRWVDGSDDAEIVTFEMLDSADNVLDAIAFDDKGGASDLSAVATTSDTGDDTETWYLLTLTGTNSAAPGVRVQFRASNTGTSDAQFYASATYLYRSTGPVFDNAFISDSRVYNRDDYDDSNTNRFNHILLYNLPGDLPALLDYELILYGASGNNRQLGVFSYPSSRHPYVTQTKECENASSTAGALTDFRPTTTARWAINTVDASASGGHAAVFTAASASVLTDYIQARLAPSDLTAWASAPRGVWVRAKTSDITSTVWFAFASDGGTVITTYDAAAFTTANTYEWLYLGVLNLAYFPAATSLNADVRIRLHVAAADTKTVTLDSVTFQPVIDGKHALVRIPSAGTGELLAMRGSQGAVVRQQTEIIPIGAPPWALEPGNVTHYIYFSQAAADNSHVQSDNVQIRINMWPRTNNLLGTI